MKLLTVIASQAVFAGVFAGVVHVPRGGEYDTLDGCDDVELNCIANVDGNIVGVAEGHFTKTCNKIKVNREHVGGPVTLTATCKGPKGKVEASTKLVVQRPRIDC
ncbi:hypothetical protein CIB48_g11477 [Xylaria polymorpha]|nr:hypothetical protein CIB48_g11477 [Xylaria polymorpha]